MFDVHKILYNVHNEVMNMRKSFKNKLDDVRKYFDSKIDNLVASDSETKIMVIKNKWDSFLNDFNQKNPTQSFYPFDDEPTRDQIERFVKKTYNIDIPNYSSSKDMDEINSTTMQTNNLINQSAKRDLLLSGLRNNDPGTSKQIFKTLDEMDRLDILTCCDKRMLFQKRLLAKTMNEFRNSISTSFRGDQEIMRKAYEIYFELLKHQLNSPTKITCWKINDMVSCELRIEQMNFDEKEKRTMELALKELLVRLSHKKNMLDDEFKKCWCEMEKTEEIIRNELLKMKSKKNRKMIDMYLKHVQSYCNFNINNINNSVIYRICKLFVDSSFNNER